MFPIETIDKVIKLQRYLDETKLQVKANLYRCLASDYIVVRNDISTVCFAVDDLDIETRDSTGRWRFGAFLSVNTVIDNDRLLAANLYGQYRISIQKVTTTDCSDILSPEDKDLI